METSKPSAFLHLTTTTTPSAVGNGGGTEAGKMVVTALWDTFKNMLALVGLTPELLFIGLGAILVFFLMASIFKTLTGRKSWSLDETKDGLE